MNTIKEKKNKAKMFAIVTAMLMLFGGLTFLIPADESDADSTPAILGLFGCGKNSNGQQGSGDTTNVTTFIQRASDIASVYCSDDTTWYIDTSGNLYGCGANNRGQQGSGDTTDVTTFTQRASNVASVCVSKTTTWYIDTSGNLYGCGSNSYGQQGSGTSGSGTDVTTFTQRASNVASVCCSTDTTWYIDTSGNLYGCGYNYFGQQGTGNTTNVTTFTQRASNVASVCCSTDTTWYIDTSGNLYGCGTNANGQQGSGDTTNVRPFTQRASNVASVCCSAYVTWYIDTSGNLYGCGSNSYGQQGSGTSGSGTDVKTFTQRASNVASVSCSTNTVWYIDTSGNLYGCGGNNEAQQGTGDYNNVTTFTQKASNVASVCASGGNTTWYIDTSGNLYGCGGNSNGQQGSGDTTSVKTFTQKASNVASVCCSSYVTWYIAPPPKLTATIQSNDTDYGTVSTASITDIEPGTAVTISQDGLTLTIGNFGSSVATPTGSDDQYTYALSGWYVNNVALQTGDTIDEDVTIEARFTQTTNQYTVTIQSNDSSYGTVSPGSVTVPYGTAITVSGNNLTVGSQAITVTPATADAHWTYTFSGWDTASTTVTGNKTITGTFERSLTPHTVSIASNNTTYGLVAPDTVSNVPYGTVITVSLNTMNVNGTPVTATPKPATQSERFSFSNWTVGGTVIGSTYTVTDDVSIVGNFTAGPNVYTVTIVAGEHGSVSRASITDVPYGTTISSSGNVVTVGTDQVTANPDQPTDKYTYSFDSWTNGTGTVSGDMTITANFTSTINEYTVTIQSNNADYGTVAPTTVLNVPYDTVIAVDGDEITIDGTTVTATPNEQTVQYVFSFGSWTLPTGSKTGTNTVITANFEATLREYTVTWVIQGDSQDQTYQYGQTPSHAAPQVPGYSFEGWTPEIVSVTGDATYTAALTPITYTITWNANGGTVDPATSQGTVEDSIDLPVPERNFYDFDGWFTSAEGGIQIAGPLHPTSNATYYAHWTMRTYTVTFDGNGGTPGTASSDGSEVMAVTMPGAELTGKFLKGWFTSAEGGDRIGLEGSTYHPSEDITLYAQWSDTQVYDYIVNFDGKGGWNVPSALLAQNSSEGTYTFTLPMNVPENTEGNNFLGWSTSPEAVTVDVEPGQSVVVNSDEPRTLYAVWSESQPENPFGFIMKTVPILVGVGLLIGVVSMFITNRMSAADMAKAIAAIAVGVILLVFVLIPISGGY